MYDFIGDIHGHAAELERLLAVLGYEHNGQQHVHPHRRRVIFLGDYIDRGPEVRRVLETVRGMVDGGSALALMGNHEFNAIAYHAEHPTGSGHFFREHSEKNNQQHDATLKQFRAETDAGRRELLAWVEWFRSLHLWQHLPGPSGSPGVRAVHACWDEPSMNAIAQHLEQLGRLTPSFMAVATDSAHPLYRAVEILLKGPEMTLPEGHTFIDKDGHARREVRTRWFESADGKTFRNYGFPPDPNHPDVPVVSAGGGYPADAPPVFFGHYWLREEHPLLVGPNVACLDRSVAKGGMLAAYRWDGERVLTASNIVAVKSQTRGNCSTGH